MLIDNRNVYLAQNLFIWCVIALIVSQVACRVSFNESTVRFVSSVEHVCKIEALKIYPTNNPDWQLIFGKNQNDIVVTSKTTSRSIKQVNLASGEVEQLIEEYGYSIQFLEASEVLMSSFLGGTGLISLLDLASNESEVVYRAEDGVKILDFVLVDSILYVLDSSQVLSLLDTNTNSIIFEENYVNSFTVDIQSRKLIFSRLSEEASYYSLYSIDIASSDRKVQKLSQDRRCEISPVISPQNQKVVFLGYESDKNPDLFIQDLSTYSASNITSSPDLVESFMSWSNNGEKIAYSAHKVGEKSDLFIIDLKNNLVTQLTNTNEVAEISPIWNADDSSLYFISDNGIQRKLSFIDLEGGSINTISNLN